MFLDSLYMAEICCCVSPNVDLGISWSSTLLCICEVLAAHHWQLLELPENIFW